jgi:nitrite reductase/ring-hydroxylating ferredoxin subunit
MTPTVAQSNLLLRPASTAQHPAAETADWTGTWVCVGLAEQLSEVGAVLPATVGYHGAHVRRTEDGLMAAMNARPFGGCVSIPVHCGSTRNVRCPHLACAFSEDGDVLDSRNDPSGASRAQFLGDGRRTVRLPLAQWGSLLFVNVTMTEPPPLPIAVTPAPDDLEVVATGLRLVPGNWLGTPPRAASAVVVALGGVGTKVTVVAPNLAMVRYGSDTFAAFSRPAGHTRSTVVWALLSPAGTIPHIDPRLLTGLASAGYRSTDEKQTSPDSRCGASHARLNDDETGPEPR